ncbi:hypothetical protein PCANC_13933 [Puccinia coronata f. sp. avenae]|uniref:Uncharacterized protein n=1 Tax=Puccinia coronata f. sp. avenae TaxID=200324 RepID=A0A2N5SUQ2_9BASI|nr:hypothetical protein PCANC_13933 [Puccinia coronata f. sp. avenae]
MNFGLKLFLPFIGLEREPGILVGFDNEGTVFRIIRLKDHKLIKTQHAIFDEKSLYIQLLLHRILRQKSGLDSGHAYPHAQKKRCAAAARRFGKACRGCTPFPEGCTPSIGVHMARNPARQACRACTPVWRVCKACTPFGQACRLCTPVNSHKPLDSRGLREPHNWCYGVRSSNCAAHKPATKFNHPDPQANDRPCPTDTHQTQPSR